jgi:hypothetical protein
MYQYFFVQLPTSAQWYAGAAALLSVFCASPDSFGGLDTDASGKANSMLAASTSLEMRFSEARCAKAVPLAVAAYNESLPSHYLEEYHNHKVPEDIQILG